MRSAAHTLGLPFLGSSKCSTGSSVFEDQDFRVLGFGLWGAGLQVPPS